MSQSLRHAARHGGAVLFTLALALAAATASSKPPPKLKSPIIMSASVNPAMSMGLAPSASASGKPKLSPEEKKAKIKEKKELVRAKVTATLKGNAMSVALKEELQRHAKRMARLARIETLAAEAKDAVIVARAKKLEEKESLRHEKWLAGYDAKTGKAGGK